MPPELWGPPLWLIVGIVLAFAYTFWPQGAAKTRVRRKKRVRVRWWEMPSPLLLGLRRQEKRMAQHKLTLSRDWRRTHRGDGDAA